MNNILGVNVNAVKAAGDRMDQQTARKSSLFYNYPACCRSGTYNKLELFSTAPYARKGCAKWTGLSMSRPMTKEMGAAG
jgi:hypothetical protein